MSRAGYVAIAAGLLPVLIYETRHVFVDGGGIDATTVSLLFMVFLIGCQFLLRAPWACLYFIGSGMNRLVVRVNGGEMPVYGAVALAPGHKHADAATRLGWLADWIKLPGGEGTPGDVLIVVSLWAVLLTLIWRSWQRSA